MFTMKRICLRKKCCDIKFPVEFLVIGWMETDTAIDRSKEANKSVVPIFT